jgi:hypothetical protein
MALCALGPSGGKSPGKGLAPLIREAVLVELDEGADGLSDRPSELFADMPVCVTRI